MYFMDSQINCYWYNSAISIMHSGCLTLAYQTRSNKSDIHFFQRQSEKT